MGTNSNRKPTQAKDSSSSLGQQAPGKRGGQIDMSALLGVVQAQCRRPQPLSVGGKQVGEQGQAMVAGISKRRNRHVGRHSWKQAASGLDVLARTACSIAVRPSQSSSCRAGHHEQLQALQIALLRRLKQRQLAVTALTAHESCVRRRAQQGGQPRRQNLY